MPSTKEREILRRLAQRVREIADDPSMPQRKQRWFDLNALRPQRPMVLAFPEGAWGELVPTSLCECEQPELARWEHHLLKQVYWWEHLRDDHVIEPVFPVGHAIRIGGYGVDVPHHRAEDAGSYVWDPPIQDIARDMEKLHFREVSVDHAESQKWFEIACDLFGDVLEVEMTCQPWWTMGLTWEAAKLIGLEQLMMAMYDDPAGLHQLMGWLRDEHMHLITTVESMGVLDVQNRFHYTGSGGVAYTDELPQPDHEPGTAARLRDLWGFAESQETVGISPEMFAEFVIPYQVPLLEKFGLNCYGCCEPVHQRLKIILENVPRLRRISASPWVDQRVFKDAVGDRYIFSRKPNPTLVCSMFDEQQIRNDLRQTLEIAGDGPLEIIMKDTHTVQNQPWRLSRWIELALEEVDRYAGATA